LYAHEQVVEIVGNAAGQRADGLHFLRLLEFAFDIFFLGNIDDDALVFHGVALFIEQGAVGPLPPEDIPGFSSGGLFVNDHGFLRVKALQSFLQASAARRR
jgi:hypothetical protein